MVANIINRLKVFVTDPVSGAQARVTPDGRLGVSQAPRVPDGKTAVGASMAGSVNGFASLVSTYVIPSGRTLRVQWFEYGGAGGAGNCSRVSLYYAPTGTITSGQAPITCGYVTCGSGWTPLDAEYVGNGTAAIVMQRSRLDAQARELYGAWKGYLE